MLLYFVKTAIIFLLSFWEGFIVNIYFIDGQGGRLGKLFIEQFKTACPDISIIAIGTNSIATATMLKAGADSGATGENPVVVACRNADIIIGPLGIVVADALLGEVTPAMAAAVGSCHAQKILIPMNRCNNTVVAAADLPLGNLIELAVAQVKKLIE